MEEDDDDDGNDDDDDDFFGFYHKIYFMTILGPGPESGLS